MKQLMVFVLLLLSIGLAQASPDTAAQINPDPQTLLSIAWNPNNPAQIARSFQNGTVEVINAQSQQVTFAHTGTAPAKAIAWSPINANRLLAGTSTSVMLFDTNTQQTVFNLEGSPYAAADQDEYGEHEAVRALTWHPDGSQFASLTNMGVFRIWDALTGQLLLDSGFGQSASISWKPDGSTVAGSTAFSIALADPQTGIYVLFAGRNLSNFIYVIAWSSDGACLAVGSVEGEVSVWNVVTEENIQYLETEANNIIRNLRFSPDGTRLAAASDDGAVRVWDAASGQLLQTFQEQTPVYALDWSPDGTQIAYGGVGGTVEIVPAPGSSPPMPDSCLTSLSLCIPAGAE